MILLRNILFLIISSGSSFAQDIHASWITNSSLEVKLPEKTIKIVEVSSSDMDIPGVTSNENCLFSGKVEGDPNSSVEVSTCQEDNSTVISINSDFVPDGIMDLSFTADGKTTIIEDESHVGAVDNEVVDIPKATGKQKKRNHRINRRVGSRKVLRKIEIGMMLWYDNNLLKRLGSHEKSKNFLKKILHFARNHLKFKKLGLEIILVIKSINHLKDVISATENDFEYLTRNPNANRRLLNSYFGYSTWAYSTGIAGMSSACRTDGTAMNINIWRAGLGKESETNEKSRF